MASPYILTFSDPNKIATITVPTASNGPGVNNYDTSLELVGPGYTNYGLPTAKNFLKLLENFAGPNQPSHAIEGQLWYDTSSTRPVLRINNGQVTTGRWPSASGIYQQDYDPIIRYTDNIARGDIWVDTSINQLKIRSSTGWLVIGPSYQSATNKSGSEATSIESTTGVRYPVILNWANGKIVEIISYNAFTPRTVIDGFATIKIGTNLTNKLLAKYNGLAEKASALALSSGVLIDASEVLKNNATQILAGSLSIESTTGLLVRPTATSDSIKIYSDLTNSAFINFATQSSAATLKLGIESSSYLKFNSGYASVGINKSPTSTSPALDVAGGGRFSGLVTINTNTSVALSVGGGASFGGSVSSAGLLVSGISTSTGKLTVGTTGGNGTIIEPARENAYDIGSLDYKFRELHVHDIYGDLFYGDVIGSVSRLSEFQTFAIQGQIVAPPIGYNGTAPVTLSATLSRDAIAGQNIATSATSTYALTVLDIDNPSAVLQRISKSNFLSDVYPNLFVPGMIISYGTSTSIPSGFLKCDHSSALITAYPALYAVIGITYGTAGPGTFRTPDMLTSTPIGSGGGYLTYIIKT
jgi:hypothetical protein